MAKLFSKQEIKEVSIAAVIIREDGSTEDLGVISYWHKNPIKRAIARLKGWQR